jgi:hypothetical protein
MNKDNGLTDSQIYKILKNKNIECKIVSKDKIPKNAMGNYIINLDNSNLSGSHWVAAIFKKNEVLYFDSYGIIYPNELKLASGSRKIYYNKKDLQSMNSSACGYYCIAFLLYVKNCESYNVFINSFSFLTNVNDNILKILLNNKNIT